MSSPTAVFLGSKAFGLNVFRALLDADPSVEWTVLHPRDHEDGRSVHEEFADFCASRGIPFDLTTQKAAYGYLAENEPEFVFVCGWYGLIPNDLLEGKSSFLGIHNSLLPKYRGGAPLVWALINGERQIGSSLFEIGAGMDDGLVYEQVQVEVSADEGVGSVLQRVEQAWLECLPDLWRKLLAGALEGWEQDHSQATYSAQRKPEDGKIDWTRSASHIHDFVRAQSSPYPGAFTDTPDGPVRIWQTSIFPAPAFGTPGQIILRGQTGPVIACGEQSALVIEQASNNSGGEDAAVLFPTLSLRL